jgi:hypothetical protein
MLRAFTMAFARSLLVLSVVLATSATAFADGSAPRLPTTAVRPAVARPVSAPRPAAPAPEHATRSDARPALRPATPSLDVSISRPAARHELLAVREEIVRRVQAGEKPVVIFDIDDTLLTWPRPDLPNRQPVPGSLAYLVSLKEAGAKIVYVTGRHEGMRAETVEQLKHFGFPIGESEQLVLNDTNLPTVDYKAAAARSVVKTLGKPIAVFDNEKENARVFRRELPDTSTTVFRLRTTSEHPDSGGMGPITVIDDFTPALPSEIRLAKQPAAAN